MALRVTRGSEFSHRTCSPEQYLISLLKRGLDVKTVPTEELTERVEIDEEVNQEEAIEKEVGGAHNNVLSFVI